MMHVDRIIKLFLLTSNGNWIGNENIEIHGWLRRRTWIFGFPNMPSARCNKGRKTSKNALSRLTKCFWHDKWVGHECSSVLRPFRGSISSLKSYSPKYNLECNMFLLISFVEFRVHSGRFKTLASKILLSQVHRCKWGVTTVKPTGLLAGLRVFEESRKNCYKQGSVGTISHGWSKTRVLLSYSFKWRIASDGIRSFMYLHHTGRFNLGPSDLQSGTPVWFEKAEAVGQVLATTCFKPDYQPGDGWWLYRLCDVTLSQGAWCEAKLPNDQWWIQGILGGPLPNHHVRVDHPVVNDHYNYNANLCFEKADSF